MKDHPLDLVRDLIQDMQDISVRMSEIRGDTDDYTALEAGQLLFDLHDAYTAIVDELRLLHEEARFMDSNEDEDDKSIIFDSNEDAYERDFIDKSGNDNWEEDLLKLPPVPWKSNKNSRTRFSENRTPIDIMPDEDPDHSGIKILDL